MRQNTEAQLDRTLGWALLIVAVFVGLALLWEGTAAAASGTTSLCIRITGWPAGPGQAPVSASVSGASVAESTLLVGTSSTQVATLLSEPARRAPETLAFAGASHSISTPSAAVVRHGDSSIEVSGLSARPVAGPEANGPIRVGLSGTAQVPAGVAAGEYEGDVLVLLSWE